MNLCDQINKHINKGLELQEMMRSNATIRPESSPGYSDILIDESYLLLK